MSDTIPSSNSQTIKIVQCVGNILHKDTAKAVFEPPDLHDFFSTGIAKHPIKNNKKVKRKKKSETAIISAEFNQSSNPAEYNSWKNAKSRCRNPKLKDKKYLKVVFSKRFEKFSDFMGHIGPKPKPSYSLDRIDNNRGYVPGNIRWASKSAQAANRSPTILIEHAGELKPIRIWAEIIQLSSSTVYGRYHRGDRHPEALFRDAKNPLKIGRPIKKKLSPISTAPEKPRPYGPTEDDIVSAIKTHNSMCGEPDGIAKAFVPGQIKSGFTKRPLI